MNSKQQSKKTKEKPKLINKSLLFIIITKIIQLNNKGIKGKNVQASSKEKNGKTFPEKNVNNMSFLSSGETIFIK